MEAVVAAAAVVGIQLHILVTHPAVITLIEVVAIIVEVVGMVAVVAMMEGAMEDAAVDVEEVGVVAVKLSQIQEQLWN